MFNPDRKKINAGSYDLCNLYTDILLAHSGAAKSEKIDEEKDGVVTRTVSLPSDVSLHLNAKGGKAYQLVLHKGNAELHINKIGGIEQFSYLLQLTNEYKPLFFILSQQNFDKYKLR